MHDAGIAALLPGTVCGTPGMWGIFVLVAIGAATGAAVALFAASRRLSAAITREAQALRQANAELTATQREIVARLGAAGEFRDRETPAHVMRMANMAHLLALAAGCEPVFAARLLAAAPLHDIGKIGICDAVLFKPSDLTQAEQLVMHRHPMFGAWILGGSELPLLQLAAEVAQTHHERWDGAGYPLGLGGEAIPLSGRIVAVADVFDALLSRRPHKSAWSLDRVIAHMTERAGKEFDPRIVDVLLRNLDDILPAWLNSADPTPHRSERDAGWQPAAAANA